MRILVVGAGAIGGYIGGRLVEKGEDVTFLVRERRKEQLRKNGLVIRSPLGNYEGKVRILTYDDQPESFDFVILCVKSYHMKAVIASLEPFLHSKSLILPFLNGVAHYPLLEEAFGKERVMGGLCFILTTLNEKGEIVHVGDRHDFVYGEWNGEITNRVEEIGKCFLGGNFAPRLSKQITNDIWSKYAFITSMSGVTTLFQSSMGPILACSNGKIFMVKLVKEISDIILAHKSDIFLHDNLEQKTITVLESLQFSAKSSMLQDMEKGLAVEADHIHGFLLDLVDNRLDKYPSLAAVYTNLKVYEAKNYYKS